MKSLLQPSSGGERGLLCLRRRNQRCTQRRCASSPWVEQHLHARGDRVHGFVVEPVGKTSNSSLSAGMS